MALGILLVLVIVGVVLVMIYGRNMLAAWTRGVVSSTLQEWNLPEDQRVEMMAQTERVLAVFVDGRLSMEQVRGIVEQVGKSPVQYIGLMHMVQIRYVVPSDMSEDEKAHAIRILDRAIRAFGHELLTNEDGKELSALLDQRPQEPTVTLPQTMTNEEILDFVANVEAKLEGLDVPDEPVDLAAILRRIVDESFEKYGIDEPE